MAKRLDQARRDEVNEEETLTKLAQAIKRYAPMEAAAKPAALQLDPRNAHQLERLEHLTAVVLASARGSESRTRPHS
jgi:hypothetical protein